eukprot:31188-Pelagococcus_subviridis.AAC.10
MVNASPCSFFSEGWVVVVGPRAETGQDSTRPQPFLVYLPDDSLIACAVLIFAASRRRRDRGNDAGEGAAGGDRLSSIVTSSQIRLFSSIEGRRRNATRRAHTRTRASAIDPHPLPPTRR